MILFNLEKINPKTQTNVLVNEIKIVYNVLGEKYEH